MSARGLDLEDARRQLHEVLFEIAREPSLDHFRNARDLRVIAAGANVLALLQQRDLEDELALAQEVERDRMARASSDDGKCEELPQGGAEVAHASAPSPFALPVMVHENTLGAGGSQNFGVLALARCASCLQVFAVRELVAAVFTCSMPCQQAHQDALREEQAQHAAAKDDAVPSGACSKCDGEGQVATTEGEEPWSQWSSLPPGSDAAVRAGIVRPKTCPRCHGFKVEPEVKS